MKKIFILFGFIVLISAIPTFEPDVFYTGFEDGDRTAGGQLNLNSTGLSCAVDGMQVSTTYARLGTKSIHSVCRFSDPICGLSHRDELLKYKNNTDSTVKDRFYNFSSLIDNLYPGGIVDGDDFILMQFKSTSQDIFPFVTVWISPDASGLYSNYVLVVQTAGTAGAAVKESTGIYILGRAYSNTWVDFTFDIDWQWNSSGSIKVYMNQTLVRTVTGRNMNPPYNTSAPRYPNFRCGLYCFGWNNGIDIVSQRDAYYDEIKIGTTGTVSDYFVPAAVTPAPVQPKFILTNYQAVKVS